MSENKGPNNPVGHKILPFRLQKATVMLLVELLLITFSVGVIWNHIDGMGLVGTYNTMAKLGLGMVEFIAFTLCVWEIFTVDRMLSFWCFVGNLVVVVMMCVHAGAVLTYDRSGAEQAQTINAVADAQAKIAAATEAARITAAGQEASRLNGIGQRATARRIAQSANIRDDGSAAQIVAQVAQNTRRHTFLPDWYLNGGMYVVPPITAFLILMFIMFISKGVVHIEDANHNGIPDFLEFGDSDKELVVAPRIQPSRQLGAATAEQGREQGGKRTAGFVPNAPKRTIKGEPGEAKEEEAKEEDTNPKA